MKNVVSEKILSFFQTPMIGYSSDFENLPGVIHLIGNRPYTYERIREELYK